MNKTEGSTNTISNTHVDLTGFQTVTHRRKRGGNHGRDVSVCSENNSVNGQKVAGLQLPSINIPFHTSVIMKQVLLSNDKYHLSNMIYTDKWTFEILRPLKVGREVKREDEVPPLYVRVANFVFRVDSLNFLEAGQLGINPAQQKLIASPNAIEVMALDKKPTHIFESCTCKIEIADSRFQKTEYHSLDRETLNKALREILSLEVIRNDHELYLQLPTGIYRIHVSGCLPISPEGFGVASPTIEIVWAHSHAIGIVNIMPKDKISKYVVELSIDSNQNTRTRYARLADSQIYTAIRTFMLSRQVSPISLYRLDKDMNINLKVNEVITTSGPMLDFKGWLVEGSPVAKIKVIWDETKIVIAHNGSTVAKRIETKILECTNSATHQHETDPKKIINQIKKENKWFAQREIFVVKVEACTYLVEVVGGFNGNKQEGKIKIRWTHNENTEFYLQMPGEAKPDREIKEEESVSEDEVDYSEEIETEESAAPGETEESAVVKETETEESTVVEEIVEVFV